MTKAEEFYRLIPKARYSSDGRKIRPCRRNPNGGTKNRRIVKTKTINDIEHTYHATKGWRSTRTHDIAHNVAGTLFRSFIP